MICRDVSRGMVDDINQQSVGDIWGCESSKVDLSQDGDRKSTILRGEIGYHSVSFGYSR